MREGHSALTHRYCSKLVYSTRTLSKKTSETILNQPLLTVPDRNAAVLPSVPAHLYKSSLQGVSPLSVFPPQRACLPQLGLQRRKERHLAFKACHLATLFTYVQAKLRVGLEQRILTSQNRGAPCCSLSMRVPHLPRSNKGGRQFNDVMSRDMGIRRSAMREGKYSHKENIILMLCDGSLYACTF